MSEWNQIGELQVAAELREFIEKEALPGTGIEPDRLWSALDAILHDLAPRNRELLKKRDDLQARIDAWYGDHRSRPIDLEEYKSFLREIGYLLPEGEDFQVSTANVDPEISTIAGPQLVVPVMNARYALNAANARWGSLYDALYGTDAIPSDDEKTPVGGYDPHRGAKVIAYARQVLDDAAPLVEGSHADASGYAIEGGKLTVTLKGGGATTLRDAANLAGYQGDAASPTAILLVNHGLHRSRRRSGRSRRNTPLPVTIDTSTLEASPLLTTVIEVLNSAAAGEIQLGYNIDVLVPPEFNDAMKTGFQAMLAGDKTAEEQAADMQAAWEEAIAECEPSPGSERAWNGSPRSLRCSPYASFAKFAKFARCIEDTRRSEP